MRVGDKVWINWNKAPVMLWQTQLNFAKWCASSACGFSSEHLNHKKHTMAKSVYRYQMYYHVRRVLKRLQVPLPNQAGFSADDNPYSNAGFFKICEDYEVPHDPMRYGGMKSSFKRTSMGVGQDYIN